jgi:hypothetical protein
MHDEAYVQQIRAYIEEHRHRYYPEAIRKRLIADGHDPALVDRLLAEAFAPLRAYADPSTAPRKLSWWDHAIIVLRIFVVLAGVLIFNAMLVGACFSSIDASSAATAVWLVVALVVFVGLLVYARWREIPLLLVAGLALAPAIGLALLAGACIAIIVAAT